MLKFKEEDFIKEVYTTHIFRNNKSPSVMGIIEETSDSFNKIHTKSSSIIIEFVKGKTLREKINSLDKNSLKDEIKLMIYVIDLAKALEFLHYRGLIHRDIKPENIIITDENEVRLIDFGIAKECNKTSAFTTCEKGSVFYEPPENTVSNIYDDIFEEDDLSKTDYGTKRRISKAYDLWSFGLIVSEIFGGETPWGEELKKKPNKIIVNLMNKVEFPIPVSIKNEKIRNVIKYCTEIFPKYRIEIKEVINLLNKIFIERIRQSCQTVDITQLFQKKESIYN